jgi:chromosome partitioning protein
VFRLRDVARVVAVANQKGGVAKTTTVHALGFALAELGRRVLLIDLDPQACLTYSAGIDPDGLDRSLHDVFVRKMKAADARRPLPGVEGIDILPSTIDLAGSEVHLLTRTGREHVLARALLPVMDDYDVVLIDCPPSLGVLTINGLTAAQEVLIPLQCEALSHRGVGQLLETIDDVRLFANADLQVRGVIATMYDERTRHARAVLEDVRERYGLPVFDPPVRKSIRFAEAPLGGLSILQHAPNSPGAEAYRAIARQLDADPRAIA